MSRDLQKSPQIFANVPGVVFGVLFFLCAGKKKKKRKKKKVNIKGKISIASQKPSNLSVLGWETGAIIGTSFDACSSETSLLAWFSTH